MWGPVVGLSARLTLSVWGSSRCCILGSGATTRKTLHPSNSRGFSVYYPQPLPHLDFEESPSSVTKNRSEPTRYITNKKLAKIVAVTLLDNYKPSRQLVLECNPGPGILTEALLRAGAKVVALESVKSFIPHLESLKRILDGELQVIPCDLFKMDPRNQEIIRPDYDSQKLFQNLGLKAAAWSEGIPLKVFGILPRKNERKILWKFLYDLYSCESMYKYGRVELNLFIGDRECQKLTATPKRPDLYNRLSVLWQVACDIKVLQTERWSSFDLNKENGHLEKSNPRMCHNLHLVRITPRKTLFTESLSPLNYNVFFHMVKQCFGKPNAPILHHLHSLSLLDADYILKRIKRRPGQKPLTMYPHDFKRLFETVEQSEESVFKWVCDTDSDNIEI